MARCPHLPDTPGRIAAVLTPPRALLALVAGAVLGFGAAVSGGVLADRSDRAPRPAMPAGFTGLEGAEAARFAAVYTRVKQEYVDAVDDHALVDKALRGMVAGLDAHSAYLDSDELDQMRHAALGAYPGIGIGGRDRARGRRRHRHRPHRSHGAHARPFGHGGAPRRAP